MKHALHLSLLLLCSLSCTWAQQSSTPTASTGATAIPALVRLGGTLTDVNGKPLTDVAGVTFLLYNESQGGAPLWMETQNVHPDKTGHYSVVLGSATSQGLPQDLFASGEARWLAVQVVGQEEQARVLLVAVPYAMKAGDAETLGGLPASAFLLAAQPSLTPGLAPGSTTTASAATSTPAAPPPATNVTGAGTLNFVPLWTSSSNIANSVLFQSGSGSTAKVGINTTTPAATLDVKGTTNIEGLLSLPATGTATATAGKNSQAQDFVASAFNSNTSTAAHQTFQWRAEPTGNNSTTPAANLNLLFGSGAASPTETGLKLSSKGLFTFATGQTFPGTGKGTVTSVATGVGLKGGPITATGTLTIDTAVVPQLKVANTFTANQSVTGNISASGSVTASNAVLSGASIGVSSTGAQYGGIFATANGGGAGLYAYNPTDCDLCVGVEGYAFGSETHTIGVFGGAVSVAGVGVYGQQSGASTTGAGFRRPAGVWGDTGADSEAGSGVLATADNNLAILAVNNSPNAFPTIYALAENGDGYSFEATGLGNGYCHIDANGNLGCTGAVTGVVPLNGGTRKVQVYAMESPQHWFEDAGSGQLTEGKTTVTLEPMFGQTVNTGIEYHVFLTPEGDCEGLYVTNKTSQGFEVHELRKGRSNVAFAYRIIATRKGYENVRMAEERPIPAPRIRRNAPLKAPTPSKPSVPDHATFVRPVAQTGAAATNNE